MTESASELPGGDGGPPNPKADAWDLIGASYWNAGYDGGPSGADCDLYLGGLQDGQPALIVGASTVSLARAAVDRGLALTVADFSPVMIAELSAELGDRAAYVCADVTSGKTALGGPFQAIMADRLINRFTLAEMQAALALLCDCLLPGGELRLSYRRGLYERDLPVLEEARRRDVLPEVFDSESYDIDYSAARAFLPDVLPAHGSIPVEVLVDFYCRRGREHRIKPGELAAIVARIGAEHRWTLRTDEQQMRKTSSDYLLQVRRLA